MIIGVPREIKDNEARVGVTPAGVGEERSGRWAENRSSSCRVIRGETTASPAATARMAPASASGGTSLSRNPLAPALSAA